MGATGRSEARPCRARITSDCDAASSSRGIPGCVVADHGVECGDDFSDAGDEGDLLVFAGGEKALIEGFDVGVEADGDHGAEVERRTRMSAAATDAPFAP